MTLKWWASVKILQQCIPNVATTLTDETLLKTLIVDVLHLMIIERIYSCECKGKEPYLHGVSKPVALSLCSCELY